MNCVERLRRGAEALPQASAEARAREDGIKAFTALTLATNRKMIELLKELDPVKVVDREKGTVEIEVPIPTIGVAPALRKLIKVAAQHDVAVPPARNKRMRILDGVSAPSRAGPILLADRSSGRLCPGSAPQGRIFYGRGRERLTDGAAAFQA